MAKPSPGAYMDVDSMYKTKNQLSVYTGIHGPSQVNFSISGSFIVSSSTTAVMSIHKQYVLASFLSTWYKLQSSERQEPWMRKCHQETPTQHGILLMIPRYCKHTTHLQAPLNHFRNSKTLTDFTMVYSHEETEQLCCLEEGLMNATTRKGHPPTVGVSTGSTSSGPIGCPRPPTDTHIQGA